MSSSSSGPVRLASALYPSRCVDAHALYWAADDQRFAAVSLTGQRLWEVEVEDGSKLVGIIDGQPAVLTFEFALVFLDPASGSVTRRVAAPEGASEVAWCDGVFAFLVASKRFGPANTLVLVDAATGERKTIVVAGLASGLAATPAGFVLSIDYVSTAYDPRGRFRWKTERVLSVSPHALLATDLGGKLARLRPEDGEPLWSFTMKGAPKNGLVQVHASADAVAVVEPTLGELALLDRETGAQRWRTRRAVASTHAPPLITTEAVVALATATAGSVWPALAAFSLADGSALGELRSKAGFDLTDGLVAGDVCVLAETGGEALYLVHMPAGATARRGPTSTPTPAPRPPVTRATEPFPARLRQRIDELGEAIEVTRFDVGPGAPAALLDRAEASIARSLPSALRTLLGQCNGLELHWRSRRDRSVQGRISLLPVERMFGDGKVWGDEAFRDDLWLEDFADDLGEEALATFKALRPLDRFHDSKPIAWRVRPEGDEEVVQIDRWTIHPLAADLTAYFDRLVDTLGCDGYVDDATVRPPGDTSRAATKKSAVKKSAAKKGAAKKGAAKKSAAKKSAAKKSAAKKGAAKKSAATKSAATKSAAKKSAAKKGAAKKGAAKVAR